MGGVDGEPRCDFDDSEDPSTAAPATVGETLTGFVCPREDEDWYEVELGAADAWIGVELEMGSTRSPVEATYALWSQTATGEAMTAVATPTADAVGGPLNEVHCVPPGRYFVVVRDQNDDAADLRNPYRLTLRTGPEMDALEPNDEPAAAVPTALGATTTATVSCAGDEDWYAFDIPAGSVLRVRLRSEIAAYEPAIQVLDSEGAIVVSDENPGGRIRATDIDIFRVLPSAGQYYVVVRDDDGDGADPGVPYELFVEALDDLDENEPNDHPSEATPLAPQTCGGAWSGWVETQGTIGSAGDVDYFAIPLTGCAGGLLEAELRIASGGLSNDAAWERQRNVQASVSLVRSHGPSACDDDLDCRTLSLPCDGNLDCEGYFNSCLTEGLCGGATVCLPSGSCGATEVERHYTTVPVPSPVTEPPPPNEALLSAPLFANEIAYIRVSDFQSDGGDPEAVYSLRMRVRTEPDAAEPNNLFVNTLTSEVPVDESLPRAVPITVQPAGGCGAGSPGWVTGRISYENDLDWYRYDHPCPGADCMVQLSVEVDAGPVDTGFFIFTGDDTWFTREFPAGASGRLGGLGAGDDCFYAYQRHSRPYHIMVRDRAGDGRNWDADQSYRFCVERIANTCQAPCVDYGATGCGQP